MALFPEQQPIDVPESEGSDPKEVFAFFGLCTYNIQVFEQGLINLVVGLRAKGLTGLTAQKFDVLFDEMGKKTLGQLIADIRRHIAVSSELENALAAALQERNYIAHHFFASHDVDFMSDNGRVDMIRELRESIMRFQTLDRQIDLIVHPLFEKLGLTEEIVQKELARKKAEAASKDL